MRALVCVLACLLVAERAVGAEPRFDPLTPDELSRVVTLLVESGRTNATTRLTRVGKLPVPKTEPVHRRAEVIALLDGVTTRVTIDLDTGATRFEPISAGQAPITSNEWRTANEALEASPVWQEALARRGIDNTDKVFCESLSAGYFDDAHSAERRVIRLPCYEISGATTNVYGRPIEGLVATVDPTTGNLLEVLDLGPVPLPSPAPQMPIANSEATQSEPRISTDLHRLQFGPWSLHASLDDRFGLIVSDVSFQHDGATRPILHSGHVSEVFVPYMDPSESWGFRTYLDAGEFGLGTLASSLVPGVDCPAKSLFLDSHHLTATARIIEKPRTICAFLQPLPGPLWRHHEALTNMTAGAVADALVVRSIASVAHYDYVFDWVFGPTGEIDIRIGATGIDAVKALPGDTNLEEGNRVTPDLIAVFHDHLFSVRLDVDIDGALNTLERQSVVLRDDRKNALARSYWTLDRAPVTREGPLGPNGHAIWRIGSSSGPDIFGEGTGYQIMPQGTVSLLHPDDSPQSRAAFSSSPLWVTEYAPEERGAAGDFPNQHPGGAGLPQFAGGDLSTDSDIVLWPTIGFRHITRPEDWPILSTVWKTVKLKPYGFFETNPTYK